MRAQPHKLAAVQTTSSKTKRSSDDEPTDCSLSIRMRKFARPWVLDPRTKARRRAYCNISGRDLVMMCCNTQRVSGRDGEDEASPPCCCQSFHVRLVHPLFSFGCGDHNGISACHYFTLESPFEVAAANTRSASWSSIRAASPLYQRSSYVAVDTARGAVLRTIDS